MGKRLISYLLFVSLILTTAGCSSILEGKTYEITPYFQAEEVPEDDTVEISTYQEFKAAVINMVQNHIETAAFRITTFDRDDLEGSLNKICQELSSVDPLGSYATYYISCQITPIITYNDVSVNIVYKKELSDISSISTVYYDRYLQILLLSSMSEYDTSCTFYTSSNEITAEHIEDSINDIYYKNPLEIVIKPEVTVTSYPSPEGERIMDVNLSYGIGYSQTVLQDMTAKLNASIQRIISGLSDNGDYDLITDLYNYLISSCRYHTLTSTSRLTSTAYSVIQNNFGDSEAFAMAFKALCDKLAIKCEVVNGKCLGEDHYWNIVTVGDNSYHVDITAELTEDIPATFLRGDEYMREKYWWDTSTVPQCSVDYDVIYGEQIPTQVP